MRTCRATSDNTSDHTKGCVAVCGRAHLPEHDRTQSCLPHSTPISSAGSTGTAPQLPKQPRQSNRGMAAAGDRWSHVGRNQNCQPQEILIIIGLDDKILVLWKEKKPRILKFPMERSSRKSWLTEMLCFNKIDTHDMNINYNKEIIVKYSICI